MTWRAPKASVLRDRVTVERKSNVSDGMGGVTDAWSALIEGEAAKIAQVRGGEAVRAQRVSGVGQVDVIFRANAGTRSIKTSDRLTDDRTGEAYNVLWIGSLDDARRYLVATCERGGAQHG